jgi:hypothetical protein
LYQAHGDSGYFAGRTGYWRYIEQKPLRLISMDIRGSIPGLRGYGLFTRSVGGDRYRQKEMYTFEDRGGK